jgi:hypothetical protein
MLLSSALSSAQADIVCSVPKFVTQPLANFASPLAELRLKSLRPAWPSGWPIQRMFRLIKHLLDPGVDLAGLKAEPIGQLGKRLLAADAATDDLSLLGRGEMPTRLPHRTYLQWG